MTCVLFLDSSRPRCYAIISTLSSQPVSEGETLYCLSWWMMLLHAQGFLEISLLIFKYQKSREDVAYQVQVPTTFDLYLPAAQNSAMHSKDHCSQV
jgi:hypothetical protein